MGSNRTVPHTPAWNIVLIPRVPQTSLEKISTAQHCTLQAASGKRCRMSSGLNLLCTSAQHQHLWALWDEASWLLSPPSPWSHGDSNGIACVGVFLQCIAGEEMGRGEEMTAFIRNAPSVGAEGSQALPKELRSSPMAVTLAMH